MISPEESLMGLVLNRLATDNLARKEVQDAFQSPEAKRLFKALPRLKAGGLAALVGLGATTGGLSLATSRYVSNKTRRKPWLSWLTRDDDFSGVADAAARGAAEGAVSMPISAWLANQVNAARVSKESFNNLAKQFKTPFLARHLNKFLGGSGKLVGRSAVTLSAAAPFILAHIAGGHIFPKKDK